MIGTVTPDTSHRFGTKLGDDNYPENDNCPTTSTTTTQAPTRTINQ